jgi:hypothetical protein
MIGRDEDIITNDGSVVVVREDIESKAIYLIFKQDDASVELSPSQARQVALALLLKTNEVEEV